MPTVSFTGVKSCTASGDSIDVVFTTRYSGDLSVTMTRACLGELVTALTGNAGEASAPAAETKPAEAPAPRRESAAKARAAAPAQSESSAPVASTTTPGAATTDGNIAVRVPKRWSVAAETKVHNVVLLFFDAQTERQSSFALSPKAAAEMAKGMIEKAKIVVEATAGKAASKAPKRGPD